MQITLENDFHNSRITLTPTETYELDSGALCAVLTWRDYKRAWDKLCGMDECCCGKVPEIGLDSDGIRYSIIFRD